MDLTGIEKFLERKSQPINGTKGKKIQFTLAPAATVSELVAA